MESTNLTETHQTEDVSKVKANHVECPGCDVRAHVQPNFCRAYYPTPQRCRGCVENCEDISLPQPCFLNPQFLQPVFHTGSLSQSHRCNHDRIGSDPNTRDPHVFCQRMKKKSVWDTVGEKTVASENEPSHLPKCQNQTRTPRWNHRSCNCGEPLRWTSGPFFIPLMPCCILWHPQAPSNNCSNYCAGQVVENLSRNVEGAGDALSNTENQEQHLEVENDCEQEDCSEDDKSKKEMDKEHNKSSSSFLSLRSFTRDEKRRYVKKKSSSPSIHNRSEANSDEEAAEEVDEVRRSISSNDSQNHYENKSSENILSNAVDDCDDSSVANDSKQTSTRASEYDLKAEDSSAEDNETDDQAKSLDMFAEENDIQVSPSNSLESVEEKDSKEYNHFSVGICISKSRMTPKKLIKNFTVTSRMESETPGKSQMSAGGGDLGGDTCTGFKVDIEPEDVPCESGRQGSLKESFEPKKPPLLKGIEDNKSNNLPADSKTLRTPRTGIARLIQDSKQRDTRTDDPRNLKREVEPSDGKCRRLLNDFQTKEEIKYEKDKSPRMTRQQRTGMEKRNQISNPNGRASKKEENLSSRQIRPHNCERNSRK